MPKNYLLSLLVFLIFQTISLGQTLDATLLELKYSNDGYPERFVKVPNGFFFSSQDDQLWFSNGTKEGTFLVKDFDSGLYDDITHITPFGEKVFFVAELAGDNRELWVSDGTEEGTIQLTSRSVGFGTENIYSIIEYKNKIYFGAFNEGFGNELWVSDGSISGTYMLKDIAENDKSSNPNDFYIFNDKLFFKAYTEEFDIELWVSDGTEAGTVLFKDIGEGPIGGMRNSQGFLSYDNHLFFFAFDGSSGSEIWKSDGTSEGTSLLKDIYVGPGSSNSTIKGAVLNDKLVFIANNGENGYKLWVTDGTESGTELLINESQGVGPTVGNNELLQKVGEKIFFVSYDGTDKSGMWVSDGSDSGTFFLNSSSPRKIGFNDSGTYIVFFGYDTNNNSVLWKSDGTETGTVIISDKVQRTNSSVVEQGFLAFENQIYFNGQNKPNGTELWVTNGTTVGTQLFFDTNHTYGISARNFKEVSGRLFFSGNRDGYNILCISDGTVAGTKYLDIGTEGLSVSEESELAGFKGKLILNGAADEHGNELWISDGTREGSYMVKDIRQGNKGSFDKNGLQTFTVIDDILYFYADDGVHGNELWRSDGTEEGTYLLKDIRQVDGSAGGSYPKQFCFLNDLIYFIVEGSGADALWQTDGTAAGTTKVIDLNDLRVLRKVNDKLILVAETSGTTYGPHDLWVSDGTEVGTTHIMSFGDGIDSNIQYTTNLNDEIYFVAKSPVTFSKAVYKSDGTVEGTISVFDASQDSTISIASADIDYLTTCGDYVYFIVRDKFGIDKELWRTDGVTTVKVSDEKVYNSITCYQNNIIYTFDDTSPFPLSPKKLKIVDSELSLPVIDISVNNGKDFDGNDIISGLFGAEEVLFIMARTDISGEELYASKLNLSTSNLNGDDDEDGVMNLLDICPNTSNGEAVDAKGCSENQKDDDNDGVPNYLDQCPNTSENINVNAFGCISIASNNFNIQTFGETCPNKNNAKIIISAIETHNYVVSFNGVQHDLTSDLTLENLSPGVYDLCIVIPEEDYEQCFSITLEEGTTISGKTTSAKSGKISVDIEEGTPPFSVIRNGELLQKTNLSSFLVDASYGDIIEISTSVSCEGKLSKTVKLADEVLAHPNPTTGYFELTLPVSKTEVRLEVYSVHSQLVSAGLHKVINGKIELDFEGKPNGVYFVKVYLDKPISIKVIKN